MIKITDTLYVAADEISEVSLNPYATAIHITMKSGTIHTKPLDRYVSAYTHLDNLIKEINLHILPNVV